MVNPFHAPHQRPLNMRPTMNLRLVPIAGPVPPGVPYMLARAGDGGGWVGQALQQEWVSDDGTFHEWRAIQVVQL